MRAAAALPRDKVVGMGVSFGKFTKTKQFRLHVTCLDYIAQHAPYKVHPPTILPPEHFSRRAHCHSPA